MSFFFFSSSANKCLCSSSSFATLITSHFILSSESSIDSMIELMVGRMTWQLPKKPQYTSHTEQWKREKGNRFRIEKKET